MKRRSRWSAVLLSALFLLNACGGTAPAEKAGESSQTSSGEKKKVAIVLPMDHLALNQTRDGMVEELEKAFGKDGIDIVVKNANGDASLLNSVMQEVVAGKPDLILPIATGPAQVAATTTKEIPIVFSAVSDPVEAKLCPSWDEAGENVTGVSDLTDIDPIFSFAQELYPQAKTVGILYSSSEVNSGVQVEEAKRSLEARGLSWKEKTITNTSELQQAAANLAESVDFFYTPTDNQVASAMPTFCQVGNQYQKAIFPGAASMVEAGGTATVGLNYTDLGRQAGIMAVRILSGSAVVDNPPEKVTKVEKILNEDQAAQLGLSLSESLRKEVRLVKTKAQ